MEETHQKFRTEIQERCWVWRASLVAQMIRNPAEFSPWVRKIPWKRAWQPTPASSPGESHGRRSLAGSSHRVKRHWSDQRSPADHWDWSYRDRSYPLAVICSCRPGVWEVLTQGYKLLHQRWILGETIFKGQKKEYLTKRCKEKIRFGSLDFC